MSLGEVRWIEHGNVNTAGTIPFFYRGNESLFIVRGGIRGSMFPDVYGKAYRYENFPWPEGKKVSLETCIALATRHRDSPLWITKEVQAQFESILEQEGYKDPVSDLEDSSSDEVQEKVMSEEEYKKNEEKNVGYPLLIKEMQQDRYKEVLDRVQSCIYSLMETISNPVLGCFGCLSGINEARRADAMLEEHEQRSFCDEFLDCFF